jgi:hypothetical protein
MKESFLLYHSFYPPIEDLSLEDKGKLLDAIFQWHKDGTFPELPEGAKIAFKFMESQFKRDLQRYDRICQRNKDNIEKRWANNPTGKTGIPDNTKNTDTDTDTDTVFTKVNREKNKTSRFSPPSVNEVKEYFILNRYPAELAEKAHKYYSEANWKDSKGNQVKNWKQKMISVWFREENKAPVKTNGHKPEYFPTINEKAI